MTFEEKDLKTGFATELIQFLEEQVKNSFTALTKWKIRIAFSPQYNHMARIINLSQPMAFFI